MAFVDMFVPEGTVEIKVADLRNIYRDEALSWAENKCLINGLKAGVPAEHILAMLDEKEEDEE